MPAIRDATQAEPPAIAARAIAEEQGPELAYYRDFRPRENDWFAISVAPHKSAGRRDAGVPHALELPLMPADA